MTKIEKIKKIDGFAANCDEFSSSSICGQDQECSKCFREHTDKHMESIVKYKKVAFNCEDEEMRKKVSCKKLCSDFKELRINSIKRLPKEECQTKMYQTFTTVNDIVNLVKKRNQ